MTYAQVSSLRRRRERSGFVPDRVRLGSRDKKYAVEILQRHQNDLKDDPNRLSTEFIVGLSNCVSRKNRNIIAEIIQNDKK